LRGHDESSDTEHAADHNFRGIAMHLGAWCLPVVYGYNHIVGELLARLWSLADVVVRATMAKGRGGGIVAPVARDPVARDWERFKLLFTNHRPILPDGYTAPLGIKTTRELAGERERARDKDETVKN
jgi:hypothetical protein